jgi:chromate transporter
MNLKTLFELYFSFFKIGGLTFGGGLSMLPMLQRELVNDKKWCTEEELLDMYAIGQCTPGIIAVNTATFVGHKRAGVAGGIFATLGMVSPSLIIIILVATVLKSFIHIPAVLHALAGIRIAVCALMMNVIITMAKKGIIDLLTGIICGLVLICALFLPVPTFVLIILSALAGIAAKTIQRNKK